MPFSATFEDKELKLNSTIQVCIRQNEVLSNIIQEFFAQLQANYPHINIITPEKRVLLGLESCFG